MYEGRINLVTPASKPAWPTKRHGTLISPGKLQDPTTAAAAAVKQSFP